MRAREMLVCVMCLGNYFPRRRLLVPRELGKTGRGAEKRGRGLAGEEALRRGLVQRGARVRCWGEGQNIYVPRE